MNLTLRKVLSCLALSLCSFSAAFAQETGVFGLGERNAAAHARSADFRSYNLFQPVAGQKHATVVGEETLLRLDMTALQQLLADRPAALRLPLRTESGKEYILELQRAAPIPADADFGVIDGSGRHRTSVNDGVHYQGVMTTAGRSMASLSAFPNGDVMVLFGNDEGNFNLGKLQDGSGIFILYNDRDLKISPHGACATKEQSPEGRPNLSGNLKTTQAKLCNRVRVYWEISNNLHTGLAGGNIATQNYVTGLFNQFSTMFANEQIQMELSSMYIWITPDIYDQTSSTTALNGFRNYWNLLGNSYNADLAHLITRANNGNGGGNGGLAYLNVLCSGMYSYAYSDVYGRYSNVPTFSWDVEVITHETGHNLGSNHTHWCGWNTGANGACGAIDNCYTVEQGSGCSTCGSTLLNSAATNAWRGSVMSYCHLVSRGINLANGFLTQPGNAIRSQVTSSSCLSPLLRASLVATPICNNNDGRIDVVLDPLNGGTAPYRYRWASRDTTPSLSNLNAPGTYSMNLIDSNNCLISIRTTLDSKLFPGDGQPVSPAIGMPICCGTTTRTLRLRSSLNVAPAACQGIYWVRSDVRLNSFAEAKAHFDTATVTVFPSATATASGATLEVTPPTACTAPIAWFFTPVAVSLPRPADSIVATGGANINFVSSASITRLGSIASLPDQTAQPAPCDAIADTPNVQTIGITVSNYTGRANRMTILIKDVSGTVVFQRSGYPGNGTYVITADSIQAPFLAAMDVYVYDYNCSSNTSCTASANTISLARKQRRAARGATMNAGCRAGMSIETSFAPNFCTKLSVTNLNVVAGWNATLAPNPANAMVKLSYVAGAAPLSLDITDVVGKRVSGYDLQAGSGTQSKSINVQSWAKGVYFFNLHDQQGNSQRMKLVVE